MSSDLSQDLARWLSLLTAASGIAEVARSIESARDELKTVLDCLKNLELDSAELKQAVGQLEETCLTKMNGLCEISAPLQEQFAQVEVHIQQTLASGDVSLGNISEIDDRLRTSIQASRDHEELQARFQADAAKLRELLSRLADESEKRTSAACQEAAGLRWAGCRRGATTLAGVGAVLGLLGAVVSAPATASVLGVAGCAAALGWGTEATISARGHDERARQFQEAAKALRSSERALEAITGRLSSSRQVGLSRHLCESLSQMLLTHCLCQQKSREAEQMKQAAIVMARSFEGIRQEKEAVEKEVRRLKRENERLRAANSDGSPGSDGSVSSNR